MVDAAQIEMANDALGVFDDVLTGVKDRLSVTAAPYITVLSEKFREAAVESNGFKDITKSAIDATIRGFGFAADSVHGLRVVIKGVELVLTGFGAAVVSAVQIALEAFAKLDEGVVWTTNKIIAALNKIGADIDLVDPFTNSPFMTGLRGIADDARDSVGAVRAELNTLALSPMPSDAIRSFMAEVEAASRTAASTVVAARKSMGGGMSIGGSESDDKAAQKEAEALAKKNEAELDAIKSRYITEEELLRQHKEVMGVIGDDFDASKFESEGQWRSIREQAEAEHLDRMTSLNRQAYDGIAGIIEQKWGKGAATTATAFKSILGTMATGSRKAFEISKAWALSDALVSTYQGIAAGVKLGYPAAIPAVAAAAATGFAQVSAIRSQSFGGAGGAAASGGGMQAVAPNPVNVGGGMPDAGKAAGQSIALQIDPDAIITGRGIISMLEEAVNNGANISFIGAN
jgi:hypothetical protein